MTNKHLVPILIALLLAAAVAAAGEETAPELGRMFDLDPGVAGGVQPSARILENPALVRTYDAGAVVHLDNGQVLRFAPNSSARLDSAVVDEVRVTVLAGHVGAWSPKGRVGWAGQRSVFVLPATDEDPLRLESRLLADGASDVTSQVRSAAMPGRGRVRTATGIE